MSDNTPFNILLVEPATLLRRTVSLTVRSLGTAGVTEAAAYATAHDFCAARAFDGAVIALDGPSQDGQADDGMALIEHIRAGKYACATSIPIAVLAPSCDAGLLQVLLAHGISRVLLKPFRARDVIDTIDGMRKQAQPRAASGPKSA